MGLLEALGLRAPPRGVVLDATTLVQVALLPCGGWRGGVAAGADAVWFSTWDATSIARVDPATRSVAAEAKLPKRPLDVALHDGTPIVLLEGDRVVRVDPATLEVVAEGRLPEGVSQIGAAGEHLWAARGDDFGPDGFAIGLVQLDPVTLAPAREVVLGRSKFTAGLLIGDDVVSTLVEDPPGEMRAVALDAATGERLPDECAPRSIGIGESGSERWLRDGLQLRRVEIASGRELAVGKVPGPRMGRTALGHGFVWICNYRNPKPGEGEHLD